MRVGILLSVLLAEVIAFAYLYPRNPWAMEKVERWLHPNYYQMPKINYVHQLKRDPPLGLKLPDHGSAPGIWKTLPSSPRGYLLVWGGDCTSCLQADLKSWQLEARRYGISMALFTSASRRDADTLLRREGISAPVLFDSQRRLAVVLNALWPGRTYLFSPHWRLLWLQKIRGSSFNPFNDRGFQAAYSEIKQ